MKVNEQMSNLTNEPSTSPSTADYTEKVCLMVMLSTFSAVGSVGNGLVIFVFQRVRDKTTAQVFIISMAVIDLFACMVIIPLTMFVEYTSNEIKYDFLCKLYHFLITSKIPMSSFIMVAIAFDRYFCICRPFARIITLSRARNIVICLALLAILFGIITSMFYGVYQVIDRIDSKRIDDEMGTNFTKSIANVDSSVTLTDRNPRYKEIRQSLISEIRQRNYTFAGDSNDYLPSVTETVYMGSCSISNVIFGPIFLQAYQRTYMAVYPVCLITVMILYFMIYRFMCQRRSKKLQQKLIMCSYVNGDGTYENTKLVSGDIDELRNNGKGKTHSTCSVPGHYQTSATGTNGVSPVGYVGCVPGTNGNSARVAQDGGKRADRLQVDTNTNNRISISPTVTTTAVTPTDLDDNMPILSFYNNTSSVSKSLKCTNVDKEQLVSGRRQSHIPAKKYQWHKNRDSMKRYKGKSRRSKPEFASDVDRLREENRAANVRTALMLFTVTFVFMVAFVPAWVMAHRLIPYNSVVFYLYFIYNVANPFIYAFMNHIFKDYMRQMFSCRTLDTAIRRTS